MILSITATSELDLLFRISNLLSNPTPTESLLESIVSEIASGMQAKKVILNILDISTGKITIESAYGLTPDEKGRGTYKVGEGITGNVVSSGNPIIVPDVSKERLFIYKTKSPFDTPLDQVSFICVPVKVQDDVIGTLNIFLARLPGQVLESCQKTLTIISSMISHHLETNRKIKAEKDDLLKENLHLRQELHRKFRPHNIIGNSAKMIQVYELIKQVAEANTTVLVRGESGTGKELVANAIHYNSRVRNGPLIKVNASAIPENLLESELFGHEKGAFTGALQQKKGMFELAEKGTLFLDEIGDLNLNLQSKLLRVLQDREFFRVGGTQPLQANVRVIAATHKDLEKEVESGTFRPDLYYRLNVFPIYLPPLRERGADIMLLADFFVERYSRVNNKPIQRISTPAIDMLMSYHWPGNVRELENCIERAVIITDDEVIHGHHLPPSLQTAAASKTEYRMDFKAAVSTLERELIVEALKETRGNMKLAAKALGVTERIIQYKVKKLDIDYRMYRSTR